MEIEKLKYPIGKFQRPEAVTDAYIQESITILEEFPGKIKQATKGISEDALNYLHRPEGWTVRQLVHHCADSHLNAFIRVKLALTENNPTVKPYFENEWVKLSDTKNAPIEWSLMIIEGMHNRLVMLLKGLKREDLQKTYFHPEYNKQVTLEELIPLYAWHCNHHLAHITQALKYKNSF